jgi:hypothetical protein
MLKIISKPGAHLSEFSGLMSFVNKDDANKLDLELRGDQMEFTERKTLAVPTVKGTQEFTFSDFAFDQFASMLKIPAKYLKTCPITGRGSMKDQIDTRMEAHAGQSHLIRLRKTEADQGISGVVRAVLPGDYAIFDNRHLVTAVQRAITQETGEFTLEMSNIQDPRSIEKHLHMRFLKKQTFDVELVHGLTKESDPHKIGFHCLTSEIGADDVNVSTMLWRQICSNGLFGWGESEVLNHKHKNFQSHEMNPLFQEAILAAVRQEAPMQDRLNKLASEPVADPSTTLQLMAARMKLSDFVREKAEEALKANPKSRYSRFDLMQLFTSAARSLPLTDRYRLETLAGKSFLGGSTGSTAAN